MSETAVQNSESRDATHSLINALGTLDPAQLSFVQLVRLQKMLTHACEDITKESERRAEIDNSGDTITVQVPHA